MFPILLLLLVGGAVAAAVSSSSSSDTGGDDGIPRISSLALALWRDNRGSIPADKLNNRGQKFTDPFGVAGACMPSGGMDAIWALPKSGKARAEYMHRAAQATAPRVSPASDALVAAANGLGAKALKGVEADLKNRTKWWADQIVKWARYTGNGYVMAFAELYAKFLKWMPPSWNGEYKRASSLSSDAASELQNALVQCIGFGMPYPMHVLDEEIGGLKDLQARSAMMTSNLKKSLVLPNQAKIMLSDWFGLLASMSASDASVQSAIGWCDSSEWGRRNLASDEQVYLVGCVFARAIGVDIVDFVAELWDRSLGWSGYPGLLTNSNVTYVKTQSGSIASVSTQANGGFAWDQKPVFGWFSDAKDADTGYRWASSCISNARQVQMLDLVINGWQMVAERTGKPSAIRNDAPKINKVG